MVPATCVPCESVDVVAGARAVVDRVVVLEEVPAVRVVGVAVAVVVNAVHGVEGVRPDVGAEVDVLVVDALVDDADVDGGAAGVARGPRLAGLAAELVGGAGRVAVHAPEVGVGVVGVGGHGVVPDLPVGFGEGDRRVILQDGDGLLDGEAALESGQLKVAPGGAALGLLVGLLGLLKQPLGERADRVFGVGLVAERGAGFELDQDFAGDVRCPAREGSAARRRRSCRGRARTRTSSRRARGW